MSASSSSDIEKAQSLVRDVILTQNNLYIKELLRDHDIDVKASANKNELAKLLGDAVDDETLTLKKLIDWIDQTEGWGNEHIYLYKIAKAVCSDSLWTKKESVAKYVRGVKKLAGAWNADTSVEYPDEWTLTGIHYDEAERELTCIWHQGSRFEQRAKNKDFERVEDDGERYIYKAWRDAARRNVARIVFRPRAARAAIFLPGVMEPVEHGTHRQSMVNEIGRILAIEENRLCRISDAITTLDEQAMQKAATVHSREALFRTADGGANVKFASKTEEGYAKYAPVRDVRRAVKDLVGDVAELYFPLPPLEGKDRTVRVNLYGDYQRVRMWARLRREDVWSILAAIA